MAKKYLVSLDLSKNELLNARLQNLATDPASPVAGQIYYNTASNKLRSYNGSTWDQYGTSTAAGTVTGVSVVSANGFSGTVADASTTPALTLGTTVTGILKGNGTAISAATAGDFPVLNQNTTGTAANVTGTVAIANGGTGATTKAAGFDALSPMTSAGDIIYGGTSGTGTRLAAGTGTQVLLGGTTPSWGAVALGTMVSGTLPATSGGTGQSTYAVGDLLVGAATNTLTKLADVATGSVLISGGVGAAPSYGKVGLTTHVSGTLPAGNGGTGNAFFSVADPATSVKTYTFPNVSTTVLTTNDVVTVAQGGTGVNTLASGNVLVGTGTTAVSTTKAAPTGTFVGDTDTQTLTNKTISGASNTISNIAQSAVTNLTTDLGNLAPKANPTFTGTVTVPTPTADTDAANKLYVDNAVQGLSWKQAVRVATTGNISLTGTQTIDGIAVVAGDRVLVKNQTTGSQNGIYVVAAGAWARGPGTNTSAEIDSMTVYVESGTSNADTVWTLTTDNPVLGTTALTFAQINGGATPVADESTQGKVALATVLETEAKTNTTNAVTPAGLASFARKYTGLIGDGTATTIAVTHGLGTQYVTAQVFDAGTNAMVECDVTLTSGTQTSFIFATAPTTNQYRVVITG